MAGLSGKRRGGGNITFLTIRNGGLAREWRNGPPKDSEIPYEDGEVMELHERTIEKGKNKGKVVYYVLHGQLVADLVDISIEETRFGGEAIKLELKAIGEDGSTEVFSVGFGTDSSYGMAFMNQIHNVDLKERLMLYPWSMTAEEWSDFTGRESEYGKAGLVLKQDLEAQDKYEKVGNAFGPADQGFEESVPGWVEVKDRRGRVTDYDKTPAVDFLLDRLEKFCEANDFTGYAGDAAEEEPEKPAPKPKKAPAPRKAAPKASGSTRAKKAATKAAKAVSQEQGDAADFNDDLPF